MKGVYLVVAIAEVAVMALLLIRMAAGPTISDRIVALNAMSTHAAIAVLLPSFPLGNEGFVVLRG